ncbi:MAG: hypothetical protein ACSHX0_03070 [Akkermansiaceae bacterium]
MNTSRNKQSRMSFLEVSLLSAAAIIVMVAGVTHAFLKNSHVEVMRAMDKTQRQIEDHRDNLNSLQVKIDKKLNIYQLRDDLERAGSDLVMIPSGTIEKIRIYPINGMASRDEQAPVIAQITP